MPIRSDYAIVLRLTEYSESSQIATLFARDSGLLRLIAKGARRGTKKRVAAGLDLMELGELSFIAANRDAQLGTLTEWVQRDAFSAVRADLARMYAGLYAIELVEATTQEHDPHPDLFDALVDMLRLLAAGRDVAIVTAEFQQHLLREVGLAPNLSACVICGKLRTTGAGAYFSARVGGLICRNCVEKHGEAIRLRAALLDSTPATGDAVDWFDLLHFHIEHVAARQFKTAKTLAAALHKRPAKRN